MKAEEEWGARTLNGSRRGPLRQACDGAFHGGEQLWRVISPSFAVHLSGACICKHDAVAE